MVTFASSSQAPAVTVFGDAMVHGALYVNGAAVDASGGGGAVDAQDLVVANLTAQDVVVDGGVTLHANLEFSVGGGDVVRLRYKPQADELPPGFQVDSTVNLVFATEYTAFAGQLNALHELVVNGTTYTPTLAHTGETAGFFGAPLTTKPVVSGTWGPDSTAGQSLAAALAVLGLIEDQTTTAP